MPWLLAVLALLSACGTPPPARQRYTFAPPDRQIRLTQLRSRLPGADPALLSRVHDATWRIEQLGDGTLGPSDFILHLRLSVPVEDTPLWLGDARPPSAAECQNEPNLTWWLPPAQCASARFADGRRLTGHDGFVAATPGVVFVYSASR